MIINYSWCKIRNISDGYGVRSGEINSKEKLMEEDSFFLGFIELLLIRDFEVRFSFLVFSIL